MDSSTCLFTALTGGYEALNEQPVAARSNVPFICFSDDPELRSETWQIRPISPLFRADPARSQRDIKLRPHIHLSDFEASLYIDNSILLTEPPEKIIEKYEVANRFWLVRHSFRDTVLDEFLEVVKRGLEEQDRVIEQLNHYAFEFPLVLQETPYCGGILLRDHTDPGVRLACETWAAHVNRYSRRDQLSVNVALRQAGLEPGVMDIDIRSSWFHSWPHSVGRRQLDPDLRGVTTFGPLAAYARQLEIAIAEKGQISP